MRAGHRAHSHRVRAHRPPPGGCVLALVFLRAFTLPGTIRAGMEDYRAAATRDFEDDERDLARRLDCPVLALWGEQGKMHAIFDVLATWREKARHVEGHALPCGHFIPEEAPDELLAALRPFLRG